MLWRIQKGREKKSAGGTEIETGGQGKGSGGLRGVAVGQPPPLVPQCSKKCIKSALLDANNILASRAAQSLRLHA